MKSIKDKIRKVAVAIAALPVAAGWTYKALGQCLYFPTDRVPPYCNPGDSCGYTLSGPYPGYCWSDPASPPNYGCYYAGTYNMMQYDAMEPGTCDGDGVCQAQFYMGDTTTGDWYEFDFCDNHGG